MQGTNEFSAPWGRLLIGITALLTLILLGVPIIALRNSSQQGVVSLLVVAGIPWGLLIGAALFTVRGYVVSGQTLLVRRLLWSDTMDLSGLISVEWTPHAMAGSIRTFGNGGFFSFSGRFRNKLLGSFRAFVTDRTRTVVLRFPKQTVVVSPDNPQAFVERIRAAINLSPGSN